MNTLPSLFDQLLDFAALDHVGRSLEPYRHHIHALADQVRAGHTALLDQGAKDNAGTQLAALHRAIFEAERYMVIPPDVANDQPFLFNIIDVIDSRQGAPDAVLLLAIVVAEVLDWPLCMLDIGGAALGRLQRGTEVLMFDPADGFRLLHAADLRGVLKARAGEGAELSAAHYRPLPAQDTALRLPNAIKHQLIRAEDYAGALTLVQAMQKAAPREYRLLLDAGVLYARTGQREAAAFALRGYIGKTEDDIARRQAQALLDDLDVGI